MNRLRSPLQSESGLAKPNWGHWISTGSFTQLGERDQGLSEAPGNGLLLRPSNSQAVRDSEAKKQAILPGSHRRSEWFVRLFGNYSMRVDLKFGFIMGAILVIPLLIPSEKPSPERTLSRYFDGMTQGDAKSVYGLLSKVDQDLIEEAEFKIPKHRQKRFKERTFKVLSARYDEQRCSVKVASSVETNERVRYERFRETLKYSTPEPQIKEMYQRWRARFLNTTELDTETYRLQYTLVFERGEWRMTEVLKDFQRNQKSTNLAAR